MSDLDSTNSNLVTDTMLGKSILNDIKDRTSIASIIGERLQLKRAGRIFKGLCPFHNEKTPSFTVNDERGLYHCFGCGEGGDIFQFIMKFEGLDFPEAVKYLADRAGIVLPSDESPERQREEDEINRKRKLYFAANEIARDFFAERLLGGAGEAARSYLNGRGIKSEFFKQHFLGYAENSWDALTSHLQRKGVSQEVAVEIGLARRRDNGQGSYDFFRNRLIFPIISARNEVLGFGGRALDEEGEKMGKYINSPDSPIYHKSNCVYGLDRAVAGIRADGRIVLVEGYMDLIALHQNGITNAVAPLGTALTAGHVSLLKRYSKDFVVIFDGDEAGKRAALRSIEIFIEAELMPRMVKLPQGEDPDTLVRKEGAEAFKKRIAGAPSLFEFFVEDALTDSGGDTAGKVKTLGRIVPILKLVRDAGARAVYVSYLSRRLDIAERSINDALKGTQSAERILVRSAVPQRGMLAKSAERILIEQLVKNPGLAKDILGEIEVDKFQDTWCRSIAELANARWKEFGSLDIGAMLSDMTDAKLASEVRAVAMGDDGIEEKDLSALVGDCLAKLKGRPNVERMSQLNAEIRIAESGGDDAKLLSLLEEKRALSKEMRGVA